MVILDNDLANVLQTERRQDATHARLMSELVKTPSDPVPTYSLSRVVAAWLRGSIATRLQRSRGFSS